MESFLFAVNAVVPIVVTVGIGYFLRCIGLMNADFAKAANKLVFRIFLPVMLFMNIYDIQDITDIQFSYIIYAVATVAVTFLVVWPLTCLVTKRADRRGPLLQATFRSNNALIGVPLAEALCGAPGVVAAALLSAVVIPLFNVLGVVSLSMFGGEGQKPSAKKIALDIVKNPLIDGIMLALAVLGIRSIFVRNGIDFRLSDITILFKVLQYLSGLATPLSLLALGAQFTFTAVSSLRREIIFGTFVRTVASPALCLGVAYLFLRNYLTGAHFAVLVSVFATPVAVSTVPMTQEMGGDAELAGQLVVWSTLVSALSIFLSSFLLRMGGVFG